MGISLCQSHHDTLQQMGWFNSPDVVSHSPAHWKSEIKVFAGLVTFATSLPGFQSASNLLCAHMVFPLSMWIPGGSPYKDSYESGLGPHTWYHFPSVISLKVLYLETITLEVRGARYSLLGKSVQPITVRSPSALPQWIQVRGGLNAWNEG